MHDPSPLALKPSFTDLETQNEDDDEEEDEVIETPVIIEIHQPSGESDSSPEKKKKRGWTNGRSFSTKDEQSSFTSYIEFDSIDDLHPLNSSLSSSDLSDLSSPNLSCSPTLSNIPRQRDAVTNTSRKKKNTLPRQVTVTPSTKRGSMVESPRVKRGVVSEPVLNKLHPKLGKRLTKDSPTMMPVLSYSTFPVSMYMYIQRQSKVILILYSTINTFWLIVLCLDIYNL